MFFFLPFFNLYLWLYVLAAIVPALFLMRYIYSKDKVEKEPPGLLAGLFLRGILAAGVSMLLEGIGESLLNYSVPDPGSVRYTMILAFLIVAVVEEGTKFFFCYRRTWKDPNFDCRFDGIVYMVFTSLGFAAIENVMYVFRYGLGVALPRAILSVPGHMGFAVFAGALYGRAKDYDKRGMESQKSTCLIVAYVAAVFLHGFYDTCAMLQTTLSSVIFYSFVIIMYALVIRLIRKESDSDYYF
ncbi:MAG: PrsW family intramembrane metalloprotease [Eubacterium sp.]|nr:PrsW family intramembrane metalloprotease [Eubacterium sp.]